MVPPMFYGEVPEAIVLSEYNGANQLCRVRGGRAGERDCATSGTGGGKAAEGRTRQNEELGPSPTPWQVQQVSERYTWGYRCFLQL